MAIEAERDSNDEILGSYKGVINKGFPPISKDVF